MKIHKCEITIRYNPEAKGYMYLIACKGCPLNYTSASFDHAIYYAIQHYGLH